MKIFWLLPLSIHNISLYKFRFESHIRFNSYRARYKVVQGTSCTRFNYFNKDVNNNNNIKIRVKQINNTSNNNNSTNTNNNNDNKIKSNSDNIEATILATI